jgi:hypothetical protein
MENSANLASSPLQREIQRLKFRKKIQAEKNCASLKAPLHHFPNGPPLVPILIRNSGN